MNSSLVVVSSSPWHTSDLHYLHLLGAIMTCLGSLCSLYLIVSLVRIEYLGKSFRLFLSVSTILLMANSQINVLIHWLGDSNPDHIVQNLSVMGYDLHLASYQLRVAHFSSMSVLLLERVLATLLIEYYNNRFNWGLRSILVFVGITALSHSMDASTRIMLGLGTVFSIIGILVFVFLNEYYSRMHLYKTISIKATVKTTRIVKWGSVAWCSYHMFSILAYHSPLPLHIREDLQCFWISVLSILLPSLIISSSQLRHGLTDLPCIFYVLSRDLDEEKRRRIQMARYSNNSG
ncbi:hypothetical protein PRIPAC_96720 [Pristionchus pacificus]|uniref:Uncharacterized protein n=1 Tax=Pristionchus pacificus TaxID=54126 RepID=A0A2A6BJW2_PRIPA|nr:hypothetical protein PRIPAC_96720 [Pristionchus pacificus]|eukprot:PDM66177.1 hypothetical protein PRIPAC_45402 [Pristionchus pacificus]